MNNLFDKVYKTILLLVGIAAIYLGFSIYQLMKERNDNGRYVPIGDRVSYVLDTRTGDVIETEY